MKKIILVILVILVGSCPVRADLVFDSGYNTFDANDPYYDEVWVINDAHLDVLGGAMWKLELMNYATANIYDGDIEWLFIQGNAVVNIQAAGDTLEMFAAGNESMAYLYAYDVTHHPTGGLAGEGWIEGIYISNDTRFSFSFYNDVSYLHVIVVCGTTVDAEVEIAPHTLNLATKGKYIKCFIRLPEAHNVADVEPNSIVLEYDANEIEPEWLWFNEDKQVVMAKFNRADVCEILEAGDIDLTVTGHLVDGTCFAGTDTIKVIDKRHLRRGRVNSNSKVVDGIEYYIQTDKAVYNLGENVQMLYRVTNLGNEDVTLGEVIADPLAYYAYMVTQDSNRIWEYHYRSIVLAFRSFSLGPHESEEGQTIWNMMNDNGTPGPEDDFLVGPGIYNTVGELDLISGERVPVSVQIKIIPGKKKR